MAISYADAMELTEIEAFVTIANLGTFTRAAEALHISQPAISRRIELLEMDLGAPLLERLRTGARLTEAGNAFLPHALRVLAELRDGADAVRDVTTGDTGALTLALVGTLANTALLDRITTFRATYPRIRLTLRTANSIEVSRLVTSGDAHLGLRYFDYPAPGLMTREVASERLVLACARDQRQVQDAEALRGNPWVSFPSGAGSSGEPFARTTERVLTVLGLDDSERIFIDSLTAQKRLIEAGFGIGLMPESAIAEELRLGTLREIDTVPIDAVAPVFLVQREGGYRSTAMECLIEVLSADGYSNCQNMCLRPRHP